VFEYQKNFNVPEAEKVKQLICRISRIEEDGRLWIWSRLKAVGPVHIRRRNEEDLTEFPESAPAIVQRSGEDILYTVSGGGNWLGSL
jgi:hypothetical protein